MQKEMSFAEHLVELRGRILKSLLALFLCSCAAFYYWEKILFFFTDYPLHLVERPPKLIYTGPVEGFMVSFKIALFGGLALSVPFILYQIWRFVAPGLFKNEKTLVLPALFFSTLFFFMGVSFAYFVVMPVSFQFLLAYAPAELTPMLSINAYIGFILKLALAFGIVFELPVFSFVLARIGLLTSSFLVRNLRYAIVIIFIVAAVLTPPDIFSQILMAVPLLILYFLSIGVARFARRKDV